MRVLSNVNIDLSASTTSLFSLLPKDISKDISITAEAKNLLYIVYSNDSVNFNKVYKKLTALLNVWAKGKKAQVAEEEVDEEIGLIVYKVYVKFNNLDTDELAKIDIKADQ